MSELHDPELRQQLGRLSGPYPDDNVAFAAWQRRVGQVRRRRAVAWTTGAAMSLIVAVVAVAALQGQTRHTMVPGKEAAESTVTTPSTVATTHAKSSTTESTEASTTASTEAPETTAVAIPGTELPDNGLPVEPTVAETSPPAPPVTAHKTTVPKGTSTTAAPAAPTAPSTEQPDSHATKKVDSIGGSLTYRLDNGRLTVTDIHEADGFEKHQPDYSGSRIGVTFTSSSHRSEITVWLENGVVKQFVNEKPESHGESFPGDGFGGGSGGGDNNG